MIEHILDVVLLIAVLVFWMRARFWKWAAKKRLGVIETQRATIDGLRGEVAELKARVTGFTYIENAWPEVIEEKRS